MIDKKIVAGLLIVFAILAVVVVASTKNPTTASDITAPNAKLPVEQPALEQTTAPVLTLPDDINSVTCQQSPAGNQYGGIGGTENNPPKGTAISQELTTQYGKPTATGICGTYWYIVGWWFNASEMVKLPSETLLYGISPYAITEGSDGIRASGDDEEDKPVIPVPEIATFILVTFGLIAILSWKKIKK